MASHVPTNVTIGMPPARPNKSFHNVEGPWSSLDTIMGVMFEGEVAIQRDA